MTKYIITTLILLSLTNLSAQKIILYGEAKPGGIIIGSAPNAEKILLDKETLKFDTNGSFVFGFDRDAEGIHYLTVHFKNRETETRKFNLTKRKYEIQKISNIAAKYITPPSKEIPRIEQEKEMMNNARKEIGIVDTAFFMSGFISPVDSGKVSGLFGSQRILNGVPKSPHNGLDIALPEGAPVYAMSDGIVRIAGDNFYYNGNFVLIDHGQGLSSVYLHMSKLNVQTGHKIKKGDKIGEVGSTGRATGDHLHWGVQWYNKRIDPESLLQLKF